MIENKEDFIVENWHFTCISTPAVSEGYDISTDTYALAIEDVTFPIIAFGANASMERIKTMPCWENRIRLMATAPKMYKLLEQLKATLSNVPPVVAEIEKILKEARGEE